MTKAQPTTNTAKTYNKSFGDLLTKTPTDYRKSFENLLALTQGSTSSSGLKPSLSAPNLCTSLNLQGTLTKKISSSTLVTDLDCSLSSITSSFAIDDDSTVDSDTNQKSVNFGQVYIREYELILGDNPETTTGPPVSLGWNYNQEEVVIDVEEYEATQGQQGIRRHKMDLVLTKEERCDLLESSCSCSLFAIRKAQFQAKEIRRSREETRKTPAHIEKWQETTEKVRRIMSNMFSKQSKAQEQKIWHDAYHFMVQTLQLQGEVEERKQLQHNQMNSKILMESRENVSSSAYTKKRSSLINTQDSNSEILKRVSNAGELVDQLEDYDLVDTSYDIFKRINSSVNI